MSKKRSEKPFSDAEYRDLLRCAKQKMVKSLLVLVDYDSNAEETVLQAARLLLEEERWFLGPDRKEPANPVPGVPPAAPGTPAKGAETP